MRVIGRYALYDEIASGGMAAVHLGRLLGPVGFSRTVAIKRLHPQFARDPEFVTMFLDEARLAARIRHPNVVPTLDVIAFQGELFLVMEYFLGESFAKLLQVAKEKAGGAPVEVACAVVAALLHGLHAAHEAKSERGEPLGMVHRDVSPQNILVGADGIARVLDFGIAKAAGRAQVTREGQLRGKMAYIAPEQFQGATADRRVDVYAASVVLWEALTSQRLFLGETEAQTISRVLNDEVTPPSALVPGISAELDRLVLRGLARDPEQRFATARDMAHELETCGPIATPLRVGEWVEVMLGPALAERARMVSEVEQVEDHQATTGSSRPPRILVSENEPTIVEYRSIAPGSDAPSEPSVDSESPFGTPAQKRRRRLLVLSVLAALLLGGALLLALGSSPAPRATVRESSPGRSAALADPTASPPPSAPLAASVAPTPDLGASAASGAAAAASAPAGARQRQRPGGSGRWKKPESCNPPYTIDGEGVRRYKMECL